MEIEIEDTIYTLFWDFDREKLRTLGFAGRVRWLEERTKEVLLRPISLLEQHIDEAFVYLAAVELVCAGIHGLATFYGNGKHGKGSPFCRFVHAFMSSDFEREAPSDKGRKQLTYCEHLEKYFRNGLDHGFAIEWGALWKANDPVWPGGYLRPNKDEQGIAICPKRFLEDFHNAVDLYFKRLVREGESSVIGKNFMKRFESIRKQECNIGRQ